MVHVIATIEVHDGKRDDLIAAFKDNVPNVLAENGCLAYEATVDADSGIPAQGGLRPETVTIVEKWASLDALKAHLQAPHMATYREKVKDIVAGVTLQVLEPA